MHLGGKNNGGHQRGNLPKVGSIADKHLQNYQLFGFIPVIEGRRYLMHAFF
jgi:hypothetical protein